MSSLSVNSVSSGNIYVSTSVAQQKVASDRADVLATETQLEQDKAQLDKDLTYLGTLQRKSHSVAQLENSHAQTNAQDRISKSAQAAKQATQQTIAALASSNSASSSLGTSINVFA